MTKSLDEMSELLPAPQQIRNWQGVLVGKAYWVLASGLFCAQFGLSFYFLDDNTNVAMNGLGRISFEPAAVQLGNLVQGEEVELPLSLRNTGNIAVRPVRIEVTCGCTVVESNLPETMLPGDEIPVVVRFTAKGYPGKSQSAILCSYDVAGTLVQTVATLGCVIKSSGPEEAELQPVPDKAFSK